MAEPIIVLGAGIDLQPASPPDLFEQQLARIKAGIFKGLRIAAWTREEIVNRELLIVARWEREYGFEAGYEGSGDMNSEAAWDACTSPRALLNYLFEYDGPEPPWSATYFRKTRLFICAVCRQVQDRLTNPMCRQAIVTGELFAEDLENSEQRQLVLAAQPDAIHPDFLQAQLTLNCVFPDGWQQWRLVTELAANHWGVSPHLQANLVRDLFRNPFLPPGSTVEASATAASLAAVAYQERGPQGLLDVTRLAVLADALEEGGCTDAEVLDHLRSAGPHVRGCWALDLVMGRN